MPAAIGFATKPELAVAMLRHAWGQGVPMRWVTADAVYGEASVLRDVVAASGRWYVLAVRAHGSVWPERPEVAVPAWRGRGRKPTKERARDENARPTPIPALVASWSDSCWQRLQGAEGEKGVCIDDWACQRVVENQDRLPGRDAWLLVRRTLTEPHECAYCRQSDRILQMSTSPSVRSQYAPRLRQKIAYNEISTANSR